MKTPKIAIIGGYGRMGAWFARYFKNKGYSVVLNARNREKLVAAAEALEVNYAETIEDAVKNADFVLVSVPISSTSKVITELAPHVDRKTVVFEIASVKGEIPETLEKQSSKYGFKAVSVHPMFGPGAANLKGHTVLIVPINGSEEAADRLMRIFRDDGAKVISTDSQTHDRMVATVLALPHFLNILFGRILLEIPDTLPKIREFSGTTFALQLLLTECVFGEDPELYSEIQMGNKEFLEFLDKIEKMFHELKNAITKKEKVEFSKTFEMVREKLKQDTEYSKAYDKFYQIIKVLKSG